MADQNAGRLQALLTNGLRHRDVLQPDGSLYGENVAIKYRQLADELNSKHRGHDRQPERAPPPAGEKPATQSRPCAAGMLASAYVGSKKRGAA